MITMDEKEKVVYEEETEAMFEELSDNKGGED